jgi:D-3-phosphoglycerate dehydrogenase
VKNEEDSLSVCGTLFAGEDPRIVRLDGYRVDAIPHGRMLVARNYDRPGVIGFIGTVLGDNDINIAGMFNARRAPGEDAALTVYNLDDPIPQSVRDQLLADERITEVKYITLDNGDDEE